MNCRTEHYVAQDNYYTDISIKYSNVNVIAYVLFYLEQEGTRKEPSLKLIRN